MNRVKSIEALNTLLEINNDRSQGYQSAILETEDYELKILFSEFQQTSEKCMVQLRDEILRFGGVPYKGTDLGSKVHRVWMDLKAAVTGNERVAILNSCEFGDSVAMDTYKTVIENNLEDLNAEDKALLVEQSFLIKGDQDKVKALKDIFIGALVFLNYKIMLTYLTAGEVKISSAYYFH
jgi:uncharacterized protein (TIGR02284 family)